MQLTNTPRSKIFGADLGIPLDRYYIDGFIQAHADRIHGRVLEVGDDRYSKDYGKGITQLDVLSLVKYNSTITLIGDLETGAGLPIGQYDCFLCTQVLQFIFDVKAAMANCLRVLKPGGALLFTGSGISQISRYEYEHGGDFWRFTDQSVSALIDKCGVHYKQKKVQAWGNFYSSVEFLNGSPIAETNQAWLDKRDEDYHMVITAEVVV